jgi:GAF domain-containing protein
MDKSTLSYLHELMHIASQVGHSRDTLEQFLTALRREFVFDNVAVYFPDETGKALDVSYARAVGRAKTAEADAAWGETFASQVVKKGSILLQDPQPGVQADDRLHQAYLLGLPLRKNDSVVGALVFVRFGGPPYEEEHIKIASFAASLLAILFERLRWNETHSELHDLKRQMQLQEDFVSTITNTTGFHQRLQHQPFARRYQLGCGNATRISGDH